MKNIIISDINGKNDSIIPYALNFAKHIDNKVDIIDTVDPRIHQGIAGAYADSQSFEVGEKLAHSEIVERDKQQTQMRIDTLLSKEASKLNFPLRVHKTIEKSSIHSLLLDTIGNEESFIISTSAFDGTAFHDMTEFLQVTDRLNNLSLIVPPGHKYQSPNKLIVLYNFNSGNNENVLKMLQHLKSVKLSVSVVDVSIHKMYHVMLAKSEAWKQAANNYLNFFMPVHTNILIGDAYIDTAVNYIRRNTYDLVAVPRNTEELTGVNKSARKNLAQLIDNISLPVLLY